MIEIEIVEISNDNLTKYYTTFVYDCGYLTTCLLFNLQPQ